jgi:AhpD family alkylhydroperoxidase
VVPWFQEAYQGPGVSTCKGRWIAIRFGNKVAYAQWEDAGPFRTDNWQYVFGNERPKPNLNKGAGLDVSPAVRDYLGIDETDVTDWRFVDFSEVPHGPWSKLGDNLTELVSLAVASQIGCSWCMDFGYFAAHSKGQSVEKFAEIPHWRESDVFTPLERDVIAFAEAMTATPPGVSDAMVDGLVASLGVPAVVELTKMVAVENERSRFNSALGLTSQGFSDRCELAPPR